MSSSRPCILIVEDTEEIARMISGYLRDRQFRTLIAGDLYQARDALSAHRVDVVVLDWMLPGPPGIDLLKIRSRKFRSNPRIIILTARSEEADVVRGLEAGADDYVTKPFSLAELHARINRLMRRSDQPAGKTRKEPEDFTIGQASVNTRRGEVRVDGRLFPLGEITYRLLVFFYTHQNQIHSRRTLLEVAWPASVKVADRTVDVHIYHLRKFLKKHCGVNALRTIRQEGYRFSLD